MRYIVIFFLFILPAHADQDSESLKLPESQDLHDKSHDPKDRECPDPPSKNKEENYFCRDKAGYIRTPGNTEPTYIFKKKEEQIRKTLHTPTFPLIF